MLPILDGTNVKVGKGDRNDDKKVEVDTRNILFVAAGAFEKSQVTDLAVELQGRLPIRAKMESLTIEDFKHILTNTEHSLLVQAIELLRTEDLNLAFEDQAIEEMARIAKELNDEENIGARRLRTVLDQVLEDINFESPDFEIKGATVVITAEYVNERCKSLYLNRDFRKYII